MLQFSFPAGRWLGVQVRVHLSLVLLLALAAGYSAVTTGSLLRGVALWLCLCAALLVRETTRAITAAYFGMPVRALLLLPVGGVMALAPRQGGLTPARSRFLAAAGTAANLLGGLLLLGFGYGLDPAVRLLSQPWISTEHILRSAVWLQFLVGAVNLLPSSALPGRRFVQTQTSPKPSSPVQPKAPGVRAAFGLGTALALAFMVSGLIFGLLWPVLLGLTLLLTAQLNRAASTGSTEAMSLTVRDVMLTEYKPLSASSTLRDALRQSTHTVQELFPVLRGERLVGWISRGTLIAHLRAEGDGFLQSVMGKTFQAAEPGEKLGDALRRASALGAAEFIPVIDQGAMIGMLTPAAMERAFSQLRLVQDPVERKAS